MEKKEAIRSYRELDVYKMAMDGAMGIFELTKRFPAEERFSLVDQIRRSSRSVCANIAEAWRKCRYEAAFFSKLSSDLFHRFSISPIHRFTVSPIHHFTVSPVHNTFGH